jgi:hypothetical protein
MNYIIEDNYDFFKELNNTLANDVNTENKCMISHLPLVYNSVTLPCKHSFNYMPLYTELRLHNNNKNITCPYCREVSNKLIPFIPLPTVKKVFGVNYPADKCMSAPECSFLLKMGSRKGLKCGRVGVINGEGVFCMSHQHHISTACESTSAAGTSEAGTSTAGTSTAGTSTAGTSASAAGTSEAGNKEIWTPAMDQLSKEKSVVELKQMLREKGLKVGGLKKELIKRLFI